jgi:hypothetical protein
MTAVAMGSCTFPLMRPNDGVGSLVWVPAPEPATSFFEKTSSIG